MGVQVIWGMDIMQRLLFKGSYHFHHIRIHDCCASAWLLGNYAPCKMSWAVGPSVWLESIHLQ